MTHRGHTSTRPWGWLSRGRRGTSHQSSPRSQGSRPDPGEYNKWSPYIKGVPVYQNGSPEEPPCYSSPPRSQTHGENSGPRRYLAYSVNHRLPSRACRRGVRIPWADESSVSDRLIDSAVKSVVVPAGKCGAYIHMRVYNRISMACGVYVEHRVCVCVCNSKPHHHKRSIGP